MQLFVFLSYKYFFETSVNDFELKDWDDRSELE